MKRPVLCAVALIGACADGFSAVAADCDPKASPSAQVICGNARFTILTDRLVRMEWSVDGTFEDRATLAVVNRKLPVPAFKAERSGNGVTIDTGCVKLTYKGGAFASGTLSASFVGGTWHFGDRPTGNLGGTYPTLDGFDGDRNVNHKQCTPLENGVVSRDGWAIVDESERHVFNRVESHWRDWIVCRPAGERKDLYLFAYGHDYKAAVSDYIRLAGKIPLPPRWAFGYWWSRYWAYSDRELRELIGDMESLGLPIDVAIIDMDWHQTWGCVGECEFGGWCNGWTGYSWNRSLFPNPKNMFSWLHRHGCASALNLHPASGIKPNEDCYRSFADDYGWKGTNAIPFKLDEEHWADCWFKNALGPVEQDGVDFWWMDWQQWKTSRWTEGLSNIFLLNHVMNAHMAELGRRPIIYHRWGGLGSHRYQVGFSGDTYSTWKTLAYLPYFTATSANVGYGYWGHDIGGFIQREDKTDPELYTRWLQYGVFTPVFKTHCTKSAKIERRFWRFPDHFGAMREALRLRYRLAPYVYTAARRAYDTGLSMCRPLYWDWPEADEAYDRTLTEHLFGDDILAFAIAAPTDSTTRESAVRLWIPNGRWYDAATGTFLEGPTTVTNRYTIEEAPFLVRAGALVPMNPDGVRNLKENPDTLVFTAYPGADRGRTFVYEDDGVGSDYAEKCAWTDAEVVREGRTVVLRVAARRGDYPGMRRERAYEFRFPGELPPETVTVDGNTISYSRFGGTDMWTYDGEGLEVRVTLSPRGCDHAVEVRLGFPTNAASVRPKLNGLVGRFRRQVREVERHKLKYESLPKEKKDWRAYEEMLRKAGLPSAITENPQLIYSRF